MLSRSKVLLIYPQMGLHGQIVKHAPLGLIYAASALVENKVPVQIFDLRLYGRNWQQSLAALISKELLLVGISIMSGIPITCAREIAMLVKEQDRAIKIVCGGPHATFYPESLFEEKNFDYVISGYGSKPLYALYCALKNNLKDLTIPGLSFREEKIKGKIVTISVENSFEFIPYKKIPYNLIADYSPYGHLNQKKIVFSIYSVLGCLYNCAFCSSPAFYKNFKKKIYLIPVEEVVEHIAFLVETYSVDTIYFIDDDSFVNLKHMEKILQLLHSRQLKLELSFRGARISEIKKMNEQFLLQLEAAGTRFMHIGVESGSDRLLKMIHKDSSYEEIVACNKKLARYKKIVPIYNFVLGLPGETIEDIKVTMKLMLQLLEDNSNCLFPTPNRYIPIHKTKLCELVEEKYGYSPAKNLLQWSKLQGEQWEYDLPWISRKQKKYHNMLILISNFIDNKIVKTLEGKGALLALFKFLNTLYRPFAMFRLRKGSVVFLWEIFFYNMAKPLLVRLFK
ncbi:MAG: B12-binding domain-containing radical SAM protein [Oligoflexia bacterium]|nr:B12-binding domain-containing radical SAM protein [Oligoflexia bacterium]